MMWCASCVRPVTKKRLGPFQCNLAEYLQNLRLSRHFANLRLSRHFVKSQSDRTVQKILRWPLQKAKTPTHGGHLPAPAPQPASFEVA